MARAYSYLRFSTPEQAAGDSERRQAEAARQYAASHDLALDESSYRDLGISAFSGANRELGALGAFLRAVQDGVIPAGSSLLLENLDRLSRMPWYDAMPTVQMLLNAGITIITLTNGRVYTADECRRNPMLMFEMGFTFTRGHEESQVKSIRVRAARENARKLAASSGRPLTFGQLPGWLRATNSVYKKIPERVKVVRRIYRLALAGYGVTAITQILNRESVPTWGRGKARAAFWQGATVKGILCNPAAMGTAVPRMNNKQVALDPIEGHFPAAVSGAPWSSVQRLFERRRPKPWENKIRNVLAGLAECAQCGARMTRVNKGNQMPYLICTRAKVGAGCEYRTVDYEALEAQLTKMPEEWGRLANLAPEKMHLADLIRQADQRLDALATEIRNVVEEIARKPSSALSRKRLELERDREEVQVARAARRTQHEDLQTGVAARRVTELRDALGRQPIDAAKVNALLRQVVVKVVIDPAEGAAHFHWRHSAMPSGFKLQTKKARPQ